MRRSKAAYVNYVCPYCWHTLNNCTCDLFPPYHLILIDKNIQEHIRILNEKGYCTTDCCEGHVDYRVNIYVSFADNYFGDAEIPNGFSYNKKRKTITYTCPTKLTKKEMEEIKTEKLEALLEWCISLSGRNTEK